MWGVGILAEGFSILRHWGLKDIAIETALSEEAIFAIRLALEGAGDLAEGVAEPAAEGRALETREGKPISHLHGETILSKF